MSTREVLRRTFEASEHPAGSPERERLNRDTLTSEYYRSHPWMTREAALMSTGEPNPVQRYYVRTFKTKAEAQVYANAAR